MIDSTFMLMILQCERVISHTGKDGVMNVAALEFFYSKYVFYFKMSNKST